MRSESRKCFNTVEPNEPVPPVIIRVLSFKIVLFMEFLLKKRSALCFYISDPAELHGNLPLKAQQIIYTQIVSQK